MMHYWTLGNRGQQSLKHEIPISKEGIHTVRAVPQVISSLINKRDPSLGVLAKWTNQYYESNNLNIQQIIDGDILQVLNGIHLSGLLQQMGEVEEVLSISDTDDNQDQDKVEDEESTPAGDTNDSDEESNKEKKDDAEGDSNGSE